MRPFVVTLRTLAGVLAISWLASCTGLLGIEELHEGGGGGGGAGTEASAGMPGARSGDGSAEGEASLQADGAVGEDAAADATVQGGAEGGAPVPDADALN